ncbi:MAG: M12 family metallo-peptidase [Sulfuricellaceae bacterium]|nr:M12 family metallo-peptidase [Sulfuricellaceae bacterium]
MIARWLFIVLILLGPQFAWAGGLAEIFIPAIKSSQQVEADMAALSLPSQAATPVMLNIADLASLTPNAEVNFTLPGNRGSYTVVYERMEASPGGNISWIGYLKPFGKNFRAILTSGPGGAYGRILTPEGEFKLHSVAGNQWLIDTTAANLKSFVAKDDDGLAPPIAASLPKQGEDFRISAVTPTPQTTIDLMVLYTAGLVTRLGSVSAAGTRIANLVATSNQSYIDSEVAITLRLVHTEAVSYSDTATQSAALDALTYGTDPTLAGVATLRTSYGADLVMLMRPFVQAMNNCGLAWIGGYGNTPISGYAAYGFSAVLDGTDGGYYCDDFTFVHELGHNMGSMHDRLTVSNSTSPTGQGAYSYSFGYGVSNAFTTVMAYPSSYTNAPRIGRFSNPYLSTCGGIACGISEAASNSANNALSLNNVRVSVANFKTSSTTCTYSINPASQSVTAGATTATVSVTAGSGCTWTASSGASWITITSGSSGSGNGTVVYSVATNTGTSSRTGTVTIAGQAFTVTQAGAAAGVDVFPLNGVMPAGWITTSGANAGWAVASDDKSEGSYSLKSGAILNSQKAQIEVTKTFTAGSVSFAQRVSSESGYDFLRFYIDGVKQQEWSGEQAWATVIYPLSAGSHTLRWSYEKDSNLISGSDAAWIDAVSLPAESVAPPLTAPACTLTASPSSISAGATSTLTANCTPAATAYTWTNTGFGATVSGGVVTPSTTTIYSVIGSNSTGSSNVATAAVIVGTAVASTTDARTYVPAASASTGYVSYLRVINTGSAVTPVSVARIDGVTGSVGSSAILTPSLAVKGARTFSAQEVEMALGTTLAAGDRPRIRVTGAISTVELQSFLLQPGGVFNEVSAAQSGSTIWVPVYIPAADAGTGYTSYLRVINPGAVATPVTIALVDGETGATTNTATLIASMPGGAAQFFSSAQIEAAMGAVIAAGNRPRIQISGNTVLEVQSFITQPGGAFTNISSGQ